MALAKEDIWQAADELDDEGINPTLQAVRKKLGRGSYTTIQEAMKEWKDRQTPNAPPPEAPPEDVSEAAAQAGATIWWLALDAALKRLEGERQQLAAEREALEARTTEATEVADALSKENEDLRKELADLRRQTEAAAARHIHRSAHQTGPGNPHLLPAKRPQGLVEQLYRRSRLDRLQLWREAPLVPVSRKR